ncbi:MAG: discoidin domain-containing protein, partial [Phycisphaerae bacterium]|nr:discoidin domain-containing protein [Phycisphaerae bacterium]
FQVCDVFLNGRRVGGHRGGYTGFCIDITEAVRQEDNLLAVRVDNHWNPRLAPRAGEHIFSGGIYRDVRLIRTGELHVPWCGQIVTTPEVAARGALVRVRTQVRNLGSSAARCTAQTALIDADGVPVATAESDRLIEAGTTAEFDQSFGVASPMLWHPDHPYLYRVRTTILQDGSPVDQVESPTGIRWFRWTAEEGFFLNGSHLYLRGANAHQDHAGWGIGITRAACQRDVRLIKEAGFNFVRGSHYPHHPAFSEACDRSGLLFWSEAPFWGKGGFGPEGYWNASAYPIDPADFEEFEQSCLQQLQEMISIHRNHPSIIAWSMTNEAFFTYHLERARELMRKMVAYSHELDPTRPAAIGGAQRGEVDHIGDIAGYNGDGARLFIAPGIPNVVSEYGAVNKPHDAFEPFWGEKQTEHFPWRAGEAIWCAFDYGSIAGRQGLKGILDHQRLPKRSWHWYRMHNLGIEPSPEPRNAPPARLQLAADKTTICGTDATDDVQIVVTVVDQEGHPVNRNPPVTLTIESGPGEFPTGRSIVFDQNTDNPIVRGMAATTMRSYYAGPTRIRADSPGLTPGTLEIVTVGEPAWVEGKTLPVDPRPYVAPVLSESARRAMANVVNVALNRPSRASTESPGHPARHGNDGDSTTFWESTDSEAWWMVDLEGYYQISGSRVTFPNAGNWRFFVEISEDGHRWTEAVNRRETPSVSAVRQDIYPPGATARYWRITLLGTADSVAQLAEVEVHGVLSTR